MNAILTEAPPPDRKAAALALAEQGFFVLPVSRKGKEPDSLLAPNGFKNATPDADVITGWFDVRPAANIGIACGAEYGLLVIDVDVRAEHNGWDSFQTIFDGTLTLTADTPSMGGHFYFKHPGVPLKAHLDNLPGIDVKGADGGGYVLAPPSTLPAGSYRWKDADIPVADLPPSLLELLRADKPTKAKPAASGPVASIVVPEGRRHNRLVELGAIYRGKGLEAHDIEVLLWDHAAQFDPPFSPDNREHQREIESVIRWYGAKPAPETDARPLEILTTAKLMQRADAAPTVQALDPILPAAGNLMVHGASGAGKSHLALSVALAIAEGSALLDWQAPAPLRVLFIDGEMSLAELKARLTAYLHGRRPPDNLLWLAARASDDDLPDLAAAAAQARYLQAIESCQAQITVFDNLSCLRHTTADSPESSAEAWHPVASFIRRLNGRSVGTVTVHHSGKNGTQRGSSHHVAVMDTVLRLVQPGAGQADPLAANDVEIIFEKHRLFSGEATAPFRAKATEDADGYVTWTRCGVDPLAEDVARLRLQGRTIRQIAEATGRSKAAVEKALSRAQARGLLPLGPTHD